MAKRKRHPCSTWCEGQLKGIVENLKLRGEITEEFKVEFVPMRGLTWVPGGSHILKCQHGREWMIKDVTDEVTPAR